jgi:hypothetical protein
MEKEKINKDRYLFALVFPLRETNNIRDKKKPIDRATIKTRLMIVISGWRTSFIDKILCYLVAMKDNS